MKTIILLIGLILLSFCLGVACWISYRLGFHHAKQKHEDTKSQLDELDLPSEEDSIHAMGESIGQYIH